MAEAIEGKIGTAFTKGALGLRIYADNDLAKPLPHVTETRFVSDKTLIHNGYAVMAEKGTNLYIQVGYQSLKTNFGFGLRINVANKDKTILVDTLYFPNTGSPKESWVFGNVEVDDQGKKFVVKTKDEITREYNEETNLSKLTFTVWPITKWKYLDESFGDGVPLGTVTRSASLGGIDRGDYSGLGKDLRHARIVADDYDKRQDLTVTFLIGDVSPI